MVQREGRAGQAQARRPGKAGHCVRWARPTGRGSSEQGHLAFPGQARVVGERVGMIHVPHIVILNPIDQKYSVASQYMDVYRFLFKNNNKHDIYCATNH